MKRLLLALLLCLPLSVHAVCTADDYRTANPKGGADLILPGQMYIHYSGMGLISSSKITDYASVTVIRGDELESGTKLWVFGSGYGNPGGGISAMRPGEDSKTTAAQTVADIKMIAVECMGLAAENVSISFIAPHFHLDHINQELFDELALAGLAVAEILIQTADHALLLVDPPPALVAPWKQEYVDKMVPIGTVTKGICSTSIFGFHTPVGNWNVVEMPGHTPGTISLRLVELSYLVIGSNVHGCASFPVYSQYFHSHGISAVGRPGPTYQPGLR